MYWGNYQGTHYFPFERYPQNAWTAARGVVGDCSCDTVSESTPARRRRRHVWHERRQPANGDRDGRTHGPLDLAIRQAAESGNPGETDVVNQGVAILGHRLFVGTNDAALLCLDARTGLLLWEVQVADTMEGFNITSPPLIVKDKIIVGHAAAKCALRGFLDAYDVMWANTCGASTRSRHRGVRRRYLEGRQLEDWRRWDVADGNLRS
jgi:outer membrane protein assembly factor BamB